MIYETMQLVVLYCGLAFPGEYIASPNPNISFVLRGKCIKELHDCVQKGKNSAEKEVLMFTCLDGYKK